DLDVHYDRAQPRGDHDGLEHLPDYGVSKTAAASVGKKPVAQLTGGLIGLANRLAADGFRGERRKAQGHSTEDPIVMREVDGAGWAARLVDLPTNPGIEVGGHGRPESKVLVVDHDRDAGGVC